jgi:hypothetical protein
LPTESGTRYRTGRHREIFCPDANLKNLIVWSVFKFFKLGCEMTDEVKTHGGKRCGSGRKRFDIQAARERQRFQLCWL